MKSSIVTTIRTSEQMSKMDSRLVEALKNATSEKGRKIPVVYQYLHRPNEPLVVDVDNTMGEISNIRYNEDGNIVGDFHIINILKIASNFQGVIDNIAASPKPSSGKNPYKFTLDACIVYDRVAKEEILRKKQEARNRISGRMAKPGEVPIVASGYGMPTLKEISEKLVDEFEKQVSEQTDNDE